MTKHLFWLPALTMGCKEGINIFTVQDDIELGAQLEAEIAANPDMYPVLDPNEYPAAYDHIERIRDEILVSEDIRYKDEFEWSVKIIDDDEMLNAFAAPGGYIYVFTGLMRFLSHEDDFSGVLGHEIAHADRRHSTRQMTKAYGLSLLLGIVLGEEGSQNTLAQVAQGLATLAFSRDMETEADTYSVHYLCDTNYAADGAATFFEQLIELGAAGGTPAFLSTHPNPDNRVENIEDVAKTNGCDLTQADADWKSVLATLP